MEQNPRYLAQLTSPLSVYTYVPRFSPNWSRNESIPSNFKWSPPQEANSPLANHHNDNVNIRGVVVIVVVEIVILLIIPAETFFQCNGCHDFSLNAQLPPSSVEFGDEPFPDLMDLSLWWLWWLYDEEEPPSILMKLIITRVNMQMSKKGSWWFRMGVQCHACLE